MIILAHGGKLNVLPYVCPHNKLIWAEEYNLLNVTECFLLRLFLIIFMVFTFDLFKV